MDSSWVLQMGYQGKEGKTQTRVAGGKVDQSSQRGKGKLRAGQGT